MQVKVTPIKSNLYRRKGVIIRGANPQEWLRVLHDLDIDILEYPVYPLPSDEAGKLYGCFVISDFDGAIESVSQLEIYQSLEDHLFIPPYSKISPLLTFQKMKELTDTQLIYLPGTGWFPLNEPIDWLNTVEFPVNNKRQFKKPSKATFIPKEIRSIQAIARDDKELEETLSSREERRANARLNPFEKIQLGVLKSLFKIGYNPNGNLDMKRRPLGRLFERFLGDNDALKSQLAHLVDRNNRSADKLLSLIRKNPKLLARLGVPLDQLGSGRGGRFGSLGGGSSISLGQLIRWIIGVCIGLFFIFNIIIRTGKWNTASVIAMLFILFFIYKALLGSGSSRERSDQSAIIQNDRMRRLREEYMRIINMEKAAGNYQKAAKLQIKLLKEYYPAAQTLKEGKHYQEAAYLFLKKCNSKDAAAECYEQAKVYDKAIDLYLDLNRYEKVGDLYVEINDRRQAEKYYKQAVDELDQSKRYLEAADLCLNKLNDFQASQNALLKGWNKNVKASECLLKYFTQLNNQKVEKEIQSTYKNYVDKSNVNQYLKVIKKFSDSHENYKGHITELSYEIIASYHESKPELANQLISLLPENVIIDRDISQFMRKNRNKRSNN